MPNMTRYTQVKTFAHDLSVISEDALIAADQEISKFTLTVDVKNVSRIVMGNRMLITTIVYRGYTE